MPELEKRVMRQEPWKVKILNVDLLLLLSVLVDVYEQFGVIVQYTLMVHLLTHERNDLFTKGIGQVKKNDYVEITKMIKSYGYW